MSCEICLGPTPRGGLLCIPCKRSYDREVRTDCSTHALIVWCARRTRRLRAMYPPSTVCRNCHAPTRLHVNGFCMPGMREQKRSKARRTK